MAANIPTGGTIIFLFTDIDGSTQLWEQHPKALKVALTRHDAMLRQARCELLAIDEVLHGRS